MNTKKNQNYLQGAIDLFHTIKELGKEHEIDDEITIHSEDDQINT